MNSVDAFFIYQTFFKEFIFKRSAGSSPKVVGFQDYVGHTGEATAEQLRKHLSAHSGFASPRLGIG